MSEEIAAIDELIALSTQRIQSDRIQQLMAKWDSRYVPHGCECFLLWLHRYGPQYQMYTTTLPSPVNDAVRDLLDVFAPLGALAYVDGKRLQFKTHVPEAKRTELADHVRKNFTPPEITSEVLRPRDEPPRP